MGALDKASQLLLGPKGQLGVFDIAGAALKIGVLVDKGFAAGQEMCDGHCPSVRLAKLLSVAAPAAAIIFAARGNSGAAETERAFADLKAQGCSIVLY